MVADAVDAHRENDDHAEGEDDGLPGVQNCEGDVSLHAEALVTRHRFVVARRLALLGAEILHRLEIQQAVDRLGVGVGVAFVHRAADADAPVRRNRRVDEIDGHRDADRQDVAPVERIKESGDDQRELDDRRHGHQHRGANDRLDRIAAAFENPRQAAGLALEVKAQRQLMEMDEDLDGEASHGVHRHRGEQRVAPLLRQRHEDAHQPVEHCQRDGAGQRARQGGRQAKSVGRQRVRRPFQRIGRRDRDGLGREHQRDREDDAKLEIDAVGRPDIGPQKPDRSDEGASITTARAGGDETRRLLMLHGVPRHEDWAEI